MPEDPGQRTFTLDTSCVIAAVRDEPEGPWVDRLVSLARDGRVRLCLTAAFDADMMRASGENRLANVAWLTGVPTLRKVPGPFRLGYSMLDGPDVLLSDQQVEMVAVIENIVLPSRFHTGRLQDPEDGFNSRWNRRLNDVQHLSAHLMAGHDAFVTSDHHDILKKRDELRSRAGITVYTPAESVHALAADAGG